MKKLGRLLEFYLPQRKNKGSDMKIDVKNAAEICKSTHDSESLRINPPAIPSSAAGTKLR